MNEKNFDLPSTMKEASPDDVLGVLGVLDTLLVENTDKINEINRWHEDDATSTSFENLIREHARIKGLTYEQYVQLSQSQRQHELYPVDGLKEFKVRRFPDSFQFTLAVVVRKYDDNCLKVAHFRNYPDRGLKIDFDYDLPTAERATLADCDELTRQLNLTWVID